MVADVGALERKNQIVLNLIILYLQIKAIKIYYANKNTLIF